MQIKQFLREKEQAANLRVSQRTLREWRQRKIVPFFKIGRVVFFDPERVQEALRKFERKEVS
jgi:helix-turn-helix protein